MSTQTIRDRTTFTGGVSFPVLPDSNNSESLGDTIPAISNINFLKFTNSAPLTVTYFKGGREGTPLSILGDGFTSIDNNTAIKTNTGGAKLLSAAKIYRFTCLNGIWYEDA